MARFLIISFLVVLVMLITSVVSDNPIYQWSFCSNTSGNYTPLGTYQLNINRVLFGQIRYNILNTGFSTGESTAQDDNKVYGVGLCRGDLTPESCETCMYNASADVIPRCSSTKEAFIWYDECFVRYSNRSFFGILDISPSGFIANPRNVLGDANQFNELVTETMGNLRTQAAFNTSNLFATGEVGFTGSNSNSNVYGLVQCIRDLSKNDCSRCLQSAIDSLPSCCTGKEGASVFLPSCYLRYETFKFYDDVRTTGGPAASPLPPPSGNRLGKGTGNKSRKRIVISTSLAAILAIALLCLFLYCRWGRKQRGKRTRQAYEDDQKFGANEMETKIMVDYQYDDISAEDQMNPQELPLVPLSVIKVATNNFADANKLGQGGFGQVYKATLNEKEIAVKRLLPTSTQGLEEFKNEVILIAKLQHRNLVRLLGCCIEEEEKLLIYEYMANTSLDMFLFEKVKRGNLSWKQRFNIINGIARGLLYLHEDSRLRIIHRDLKASNVLLDNEMNPKISDFGMARIFGGNQSEANTNRVVGTYGYMAPEYAMQGLFSVKSDVYSFGVLLLEIISGKRNNNEFYQSEHAQSLLAYAWRLWCDGRGLEFIDSLMGVSCDLNEVLKCMHIGLLCVQEDAADRPTMSTVVVMFASYTITLPGPTQPAFSVGRLVTESSKFSETSTSGSTNEITVSEVLAR